MKSIYKQVERNKIINPGRYKQKVKYPNEITNTNKNLPNTLINKGKLPTQGEKLACGDLGSYVQFAR